MSLEAETLETETSYVDIDVSTEDDIIPVEDTSEEPPADDQPKHHSELWYEDGNVILITENVAFRVHRSILSRRSQVFKDLFAFPQPESIDTLEDCPLIHLSDGAEDLAHLLEAIYNGIRFQRHGIKTLWKDLKPLLLLSNKYQVEDVQREVIHKFQSYYVDDIEDWDSSYYPNPPPDGYVPFRAAEDCIAMANIARLLDIHIAHRHVMYDCCQLSVDTLMRGVMPEGSQTYDRLSEDDLLSCLKGQQTLMKESFALWGSLLDPYIECGNDECVANQVVLRRVFERDQTRCLSTDPLYSEDQHIADKNAENPLCEQCFGTVKIRYKEKRGDILLRLKELFPS